MDSRYLSSHGLRAPYVLLLLRLPASTVAELTTVIIHPSPVLELRQATPTNDDSSPMPTGTSTHQGGGSDSGGLDNDPAHVFNYYFLLIAIIIAILLLGFIFAGRRRKRKTLLLLNTRQEALRRDLEGWPGGGPRAQRTDNPTPSRWGAGSRGWRSRNADDMGVIRRDEGLDELGEAPPPYNPGDKPPSIAQGRRASHTSQRDGIDSGADLAVPLRALSRNNMEHNPPGYIESVSNNGSEDSVRVTRPDTATIPTTNRVDSGRRLLDSTEGSPH